MSGGTGEFFWTESGATVGTGSDWSGVAETPRWAPTVLPFVSESTQAKAPEVEAREAVERQRKDEADRQERETAAKRSHELAVLKATLDHSAAVRGLGVFYPENVALLMGGAAVLSAVMTGLIALAIP